MIWNVFGFRYKYTIGKQFSDMNMLSKCDNQQQMRIMCVLCHKEEKVSKIGDDMPAEVRIRQILIISNIMGKLINNAFVVWKSNKRWVPLKDLWALSSESALASLLIFFYRISHALTDDNIFWKPRETPGEGTRGSSWYHSISRNAEAWNDKGLRWICKWRCWI